MEVSLVQESWREDLDILLRSLLALALGGVIGWEREAAGKWAGFRTHMLVCLAAMLFASVGSFLIRTYHDTFETIDLRPDPIRLTEAIVTGIAFIGAGAVLRDRTGRHARGLTTAATLLVVGPIGIAVAAGHYVLAIGTTIIVYLVLSTLGRLESAAFGRDRKSDGDDPSKAETPPIVTPKGPIE